METVLVQLLAPYLPRLVRGVTEGAQAVAGGVADAAWDYAQKVWERLRPAIGDRPPATEAVGDLADAPDDADAQAVLRVQLKKLLRDDPSLADELATLLDGAKRSGVVAAGDGNIAVGGSVTADHGGVAAGGNIAGGVNIAGR